MLDNLRVHDVALTPSQVRYLFQFDVSRMSPGRTIDALGVPCLRGRRFHPKASAIMFSTRWQRQDRGEFDMMRDFHATHCLWVYGTNAQYIKEVKQRVGFYEGSLNGMWGYAAAGAQPSAEGDTSGREQDLDGNKTLMTHMLHWKGQPRWEGCHNSPAFRAIFWQAAD